MTTMHPFADRPRAERGPTPWRSQVMRIAALRGEIPGVHTLDLTFRDDGPEVRDYRFLPGQFNMLHLPGIGEAAISIASSPRLTAPVGHTFRAVGNVTHALARLRVGEQVVLRGPFGRPWPLEALEGGDVVIAAGGLGLASMRSAILHVIDRRGDFGTVAVLHGAKAPRDLLFTVEYAAWREAGLDVRVIADVADAAWNGPVGFVPDLFEGLSVTPGRTALLCCGPEPMMHAVIARAREAGIDDRRMWLSLERNMACAAGFCGLCQFGPTFVCKDGPVFRFDEIAPFLAVRNL
jgi:NAD(P)H-flavin reductase